MKITRSSITRAVEAVLETGCRKATVYLGSRAVVKCTARMRPDKREKALSFVLTIGSPNFAERRFIRLCFKAGQPLPLKKTQLQWWPKKKPAKRKRRNERTSARVATEAARVLQDEKSSKLERTLAASVLTQTADRRKKP